MQERLWRKVNLVHCWWECKLIQPLWRTIWKFLKKQKIELPHDPAIPLLGIYPEKIVIQKDTCTPMFTEALFTIARTWKQSRCPLADERIKTLWCIYTVEYYSAVKKQILISSNEVNEPLVCYISSVQFNCSVMSNSL